MNNLGQLLAQWAAGGLSPAELAALKQLLAKPEARAELVDDWLLDETIYHTLRSQPAEAPAAAQAQLAGAWAPPAARPARARRRLFPWLVWHEVRISLRWPLGVAAAASLALAGLHFYFQQAAVGQLTDLRAPVAVERAGRKLSAGPGQLLYPGDLLRVPADGAATLAWTEEPTRLDLAAGAELQLLNPMRGKRLSLRTGTLDASVAPQSRWRPMIIATPQAEAKVVGTHFSLSATAASTRIEVLEGAVRLRKRLLASVDDHRQLTVRAGQTATAAPAVKLEAQFLTGFLSSDLWTVLPDTPFAEAPSRGTWLSQPAAAPAPPNAVERLRGFLLAPASGDYTFWLATLEDKTPAELWLSTDAKPAHKRRLAYVMPREPGREGTAPGARPRSGPASRLEADLQGSPSQESAPQRLVQGRRYYLELWHEGVGLEAVYFAWRLPGEAGGAPPQKVALQALCPFIDSSAPDSGPGAK